MVCGRQLLKWHSMFSSTDIHPCVNPSPWIWPEPCDLLPIIECSKCDGMSLSRLGYKKLWFSFCQQTLFCWLWQSKLSCWRGLYGQKLRVASGKQPARNSDPQSSNTWGTEFCQWPYELGKGVFPSWAFRWDHRYESWSIHWLQPCERSGGRGPS